MKNADNIFKSWDKFFIIKLIHELQIALKHNVETWPNKLHCHINSKYLFKSTCSIESDRERLIISHIFENSLAYLLDMRFILELIVTIDTISLTCSQPHKWLVTHEFRKYKGDEHLLHLFFQVFLGINLILQSSNWKHQSLLYSPVSPFFALDLQIVLLKVLNGKP